MIVHERNHIPFYCFNNGYTNFNKADLVCAAHVYLYLYSKDTQNEVRISKIEDSFSRALSLCSDTFNRVLISLCFVNNGSIGFDPKFNCHKHVSSFRLTRKEFNTPLVAIYTPVFVNTFDIP